MKRGFTLVELSIVLVIIGLLIGGILVAVSMVQTTKVQRLAIDLGKYEISINNFKQNFKNYPGDSNYFTPPGNNNGVLYLNGPGTCAAAPYDMYLNGEYAHVWAHLSQSKMIDKDFPAFSPPDCGGSNQWADQSAGKYSPYTELEEPAAALYGSRTFYWQPQKVSADGNFHIQIVTSPLQTLALEQKLGSGTYDYTEKQVGLVNGAGAGNCIDINSNQASCGTPDAVYAPLYFYLNPI